MARILLSRPSKRVAEADLIAEALQKLGHDVTRAATLSGTVQTIERHKKPFGLLILYHYLPGPTNARTLFGTFNPFQEEGLKLLNIQEKGPFTGMGVPTAYSSEFIKQVQQGNHTLLNTIIKAVLQGEPIPQET